MKIFYLTKRMDACFAVRIQTPMSHLNTRGHSCQDGVFEQLVYCEQCMQKNLPSGPYEVQLDDDTKSCPCCKIELFSLEDARQWRQEIEAGLEANDIIVFQRPTELSHLRLMRKAKAMGKKVVETCDDDYLNVPSWNSGYRHYTERRAIIEESFRICDAMDVTTEVLKELYSPYCKNITVLQNQLDIELIDKTPAMSAFIIFDRAGKKITMDEFEAMRSGKKLIWWSGSPTHEKDLEIIVSACRRISRTEDVLLGFGGYIHRSLLEQIPKDKLVLFSLVSCSEYYSLCKGIKADIGLAPVCDVQFNRGKSSLKSLEYQSLRVFPVMSDLVTYLRSSPRGIYSKNDEYSWYKALQETIHMDSADMESALAENRKFIEDNYDIKKNIQLWEKFYENL